MEKRKAPACSIQKSKAEEKMREAGYQCSVIDGVLVFTGEHSKKEVKSILSMMDRIGYRASWAIRKSTGRGVQR